jgi:hypothetical protein
MVVSLHAKLHKLRWITALRWPVTVNLPVSDHYNNALTFQKITYDMTQLGDTYSFRVGRHCRQARRRGAPKHAYACNAVSAAIRHIVLALDTFLMVWYRGIKKVSICADWESTKYMYQIPKMHSSCRKERVHSLCPHGNSHRVSYIIYTSSHIVTSK